MKCTRYSLTYSGRHGRSLASTIGRLKVTARPSRTARCRCRQKLTRRSSYSGFAGNAGLKKWKNFSKPANNKRTPTIQMKVKLIAALAALCLTGCGTITNAHVRHMDDAHLQLRHYQLAKQTSRGGWGTGYEDLQDNIREQEAIEREMMARGMINSAYLAGRGW